MNQPPAARLTPDIARDLCQRQQLKALLTGEIAQLGASYAIALEAVDCASGDTLVRELAEAPAKEQVLQAVGRATTALRERLGESLASIRKLDTPIEQATTSSLEALRALTQADALRAQGKRLEALAVFKRAIALDPDFALAHARLGVLYQNLSENTLASAHRTRAFELRARGSERERFYIEASYYGSTALDQASARETFYQWSQTYPRDATPVHNLGTIEDSEGRYERALDYFRASVQIDPSVELMHLNVISKATQLGRLEEASAALKVAVARFGETPQVQTVAYSLAIAQGDQAAAERLEAAAADGAPLAGEIARFAAARGKLYAARTRTGRLAAELERQGLSEGAALYLSEQATYDALTGCADCVEQSRARIERLSAPDTIPRRLLSYALSLAAGAKPTNIWIPADLPLGAPQAFHVSTAMIRAQIALNQSRATDAVSLMRPLESSLLVPGPGLRAVEIYARALLAAGDTHGAVAQLMRVVNRQTNRPRRFTRLRSSVWPRRTPRLDVRPRRALPTRSSSQAGRTPTPTSHSCSRRAPPTQS